MDIVAIIQARMGSTRLPGKVLMDLFGKTVLEHVIDRVKICPLVDKIVVATTTLPIDDVIVQECARINIHTFRGSSEDVLSRYYGAAKESGADIIIRVTSDCPLFDPDVLTNMLERFNVDYLSNTIKRTFPKGLDAEIFTMSTLERAHIEATDDYDREHVTPYIYNNPDKFVLSSFEDVNDNSNQRLTLDTPEDWEIIKLACTSQP